jgi:hypothetical protein
MDSHSALTTSAGLLPPELTSVLPALSEPMRSVYKAQLQVIQMLENPVMIEAQSDLVLAHLDSAVAVPSAATGQIVRTGAVLITYQLFLAYAFVVYQEDRNREQLEKAINEFVSKLISDMFASAAAVGTAFDPQLLALSMSAAYRTRLAQDGPGVVSRVIGFFFDRSKAAAARKAYLDTAFRVVGKAARRSYFRGHGQHLVDFLKRHEAEIIELAVKRRILSSSQLAFVWIICSLPVIGGVSGVTYLTGLSGSVLGIIWRAIVWGGTVYITGVMSIFAVYPWLVRRITENRLHRIYRHLEGQPVLLGPA